MSDRPISPSPAASSRAAVAARGVILADGRTWGLALPGPRYRPAVATRLDDLGRPVRSVRVAARLGYPRAVEILIDRLRLACGAGPDHDGEHQRFAALMDLAVALLTRAHDLTPDQAGALLDLDRDGLARLVDAVLAALAGMTGSDPPGGADAPTNPP